ncbi:GYD domain protein [Rhodococcus sp. SRB_17]|uniref:GYD domain-containing protein n=1 Tax=Rhodococcus sp. OK302 TaxID=1882769 RepID=UPI000B93A276|nr:GYD domain-containing protein [Rhodococcus sp. OK302]NMM90101.1 GYD domain protein [Rhodococcus sp. SRB_17]OYD67081.1 uncharacterized protein with GYD domain [Rhodococcus sp. OK302]
MPKYLWQVTYSTTGAAGLQKEGGSARRDAVTRMVESIGGTVESCHFALGSHDMFVIGTLPDNIAAAALSIRTAAEGAARSESITLLTPEEIDEAVNRRTDYRKPGAE